ncbi:hypothetical protein CI238_13007 [Colletotrichum incanum]|uniref:Uncharacterized protein n=1 Tax=Colletotrichum incanum TaxID=1573173 RepID=A0A166ZG11_COLIC|nr:hypothetical protein CI238_13007 [Colletotrichum incanum]
MLLDNKSKRKGLQAQLKALPPDNPAENIIAFLDDRKCGKKRRPSRICSNSLPYRYEPDRKVDLGKGVITIPVFANLAHFLSKRDVLTLARDSSCFEKAKESLKDEEIPQSWSDCLREWSKENSELGLEFYCEIQGIQANTRKRRNSTLSPQSKRQRVGPNSGINDTVRNTNLNTALEDMTRYLDVAKTTEARRSSSNSFLAISENDETNNRIITDMPVSSPVRSPQIRSVVNASPVESSQSHSDSLKNQPDDNPSISLEARNNIMRTALSRCYVAAYPVQMFAGLIKQAEQDVKFSYHPSYKDGYCSHRIDSNAASFCIRASRNILEEIGCPSEASHFIAKFPLVARLFEACGQNYTTSVFWHLRSSVTHIREGFDVVWESVSDWVSFLNYLRSVRSQVSELSSLYKMLLSYPLKTKAISPSY